MVSLIAFMSTGMCSGTSSTEDKVFEQKNVLFFSFKCLICDFSNNFIFYDSV
jgi:hypothetical protein